jgi:hypothetical protein
MPARTRPWLLGPTVALQLAAGLVAVIETSAAATALGAFTVVGHLVPAQ